jgi:ABC-type Fe3+/spermidine/putrescine transport system ATPase subunit
LGAVDVGFELRSVSRDYEGVAAVSQVSLRIGDGERLAIIGPSGCGKSTILRLLAGIDAPSGGEVLLDKSIISKPRRVLLPPHRRGVAMVFQDLGLWPNLSILDNVKLGLSGQKLSHVEIDRRARATLSLCRIEEIAKRRPGAVSGGQQQRAALARALAGSPRFLFLDEPFSGLDLITKQPLLNDISRLADAQHVALVLVTHDPVEAARLCRSAVVLDRGRVVESGRLEQLLDAPKSDFLRLFGEVIKAVAARG